jgi:type IV secretory pathway TraG/TraD family ATPase VirD4
MNDLKLMAKHLASKKDDAALLANSFIASVGSDGKVASNVVATLATALTSWASTDVRLNTSASDFNAEWMVAQPRVILLTCPVRMRAVYASYLGATLRKLMLDLETIGERNQGALPVPIGVILDGLPTLGTLDSLVTPQVGNCTIFTRYVEAGFATQVVLHARLMRFYERED